MVCSYYSYLLIKLVNATYIRNFVTFTNFDSIYSIIHNVSGLLVIKGGLFVSRTRQESGQLTLNDRVKIQSAIEMNKFAQELATTLNVSRQTIYREIKRNRRFVKRYPSKLAHIDNELLISQS